MLEPDFMIGAYFSLITLVSALLIRFNFFFNLNYRASFPLNPFFCYSNFFLLPQSCPNFLVYKPKGMVLYIQLDCSWKASIVLKFYFIKDFFCFTRLWKKSSKKMFELHMLMAGKVSPFSYSGSDEKISKEFKTAKNIAEWRRCRILWRSLL